MEKKKWSPWVLVALFAGIAASIPLGLFGLFIARQISRALFEPVSITTRGGVTSFNHGSDFLFARSGDAWGILWTKERKIDTGQLDIDIYCREEIYFGLFDDAVNPKLKNPIKLFEKKCDLGGRYNLLATEEGFAIAYLEGNAVRLATYDLKTAKFTGDTPLLAPDLGKVLTANSLFGDVISTSYYKEGVFFFGLKEGNRFKVVGVRPGEEPMDIFSSDLPPHVYKVTYQGFFAGPTVLLWAHHQIAGFGIPSAGGDIRYAFSPDGKSFDRTDVLMSYDGSQGGNIDLAVLRGPDAISVVIHKDKEIWQQRFDLQGTRLGSPQLLVRSEDGIYNFNAADTDSGCFIFYTEGNFDLMSYSCRTGDVHRVGDHFAVRTGCHGSTCLFTSGNTVRKLDVSKYPPE